MRNQKNSYSLNRQNEENVKKSQKQDVNLQKNATIYFQVGLIICLLFSYGLLEMKFESKNYIPEVVYNSSEPLDYVQKEFKIYEDQKAKVVKKRKIEPVVFKEPVIKDNSDPAKETPEIITEPKKTSVLPKEPDFSGLVDEPSEPTEVPYAFVEVVPVFPGCEDATNNAERKACMSEKIAKHIQKKFDTDIASELGLSGRQRINVAFKINQHGEITDVRAISKYKELKLEAEDVIGKLPKMIPGKQHDKNVSVVYAQPIVFNANN